MAKATRKKNEEETSAPELQLARPVQRREGGGRVNPKYAAELLARSGHSNDEDSHAFLDRPESTDPIVEEMGENVLQSATTGEDNDEAALDPNGPDEEGNSFVVTKAEDEFGYEPDESNPEDAEPEAFPTTQSTGEPETSE